MLEQKQKRYITSDQMTSNVSLQETILKPAQVDVRKFIYPETIFDLTTTASEEKKRLKSLDPYSVKQWKKLLADLKAHELDATDMRLRTLSLIQTWASAPDNRAPMLFIAPGLVKALTEAAAVDKPKPKKIAVNILHFFSMAHENLSFLASDTDLIRALAAVARDKSLDFRIEALMTLRNLAGNDNNNCIIMADLSLGLVQTLTELIPNLEETQSLRSLTLEILAALVVPQGNRVSLGNREVGLVQALIDTTKDYQLESSHSTLQMLLHFATVPRVRGTLLTEFNGLLSVLVDIIRDHANPANVHSALVIISQLSAAEENISIMLQPQYSLMEQLTQFLEGADVAIQSLTLSTFHNLSMYPPARETVATTFSPLLNDLLAKSIAANQVQALDVLIVLLSPDSLGAGNFLFIEPSTISTIVGMLEHAVSEYSLHSKAALVLRLLVDGRQTAMADVLRENGDDVLLPTVRLMNTARDSTKMMVLGLIHSLSTIALHRQILVSSSLGVINSLVQVLSAGTLPEQHVVVSILCNIASDLDCRILMASMDLRRLVHVLVLIFLQQVCVSGDGSLHIRGLDDASLNGPYDTSPSYESRCEMPVYHHRHNEDLWLEFSAAKRQWQLKATATKGSDSCIACLDCERPRHPADCTSTWSLYKDSKWAMQVMSKVQRPSPSIELKSLAGVAAVHCNGVYDPTDELCGGMPVYQQRENDDLWLEFHAGKKQWQLRRTEYRGVDKCTAYLNSVTIRALEACTGSWYVYDDFASRQWIEQVDASTTPVIIPIVKRQLAIDILLTMSTEPRLGAALMQPSAGLLLTHSTILKSDRKEDIKVALQILANLAETVDHRSTVAFPSFEFVCELQRLALLDSAAEDTEMIDNVFRILNYLTSSPSLVDANYSKQLLVVLSRGLQRGPGVAQLHATMTIGHISLQPGYRNEVAEAELNIVPQLIGIVSDVDCDGSGIDSTSSGASGADLRESYWSERETLEWGRCRRLSIKYNRNVIATTLNPNIEHLTKTKVEALEVLKNLSFSKANRNSLAAANDERLITAVAAIVGDKSRPRSQLLAVTTLNNLAQSADLTARIAAVAPMIIVKLVDMLRSYSEEFLTCPPHSLSVADRNANSDGVGSSAASSEASSSTGTCGTGGYVGAPGVVDVTASVGDADDAATTKRECALEAVEALKKIMGISEQRVIVMSPELGLKSLLLLLVRSPMPALSQAVASLLSDMNE